MVKTKTALYMHDIELHFTEKEKRTQTRKLKRFDSGGSRVDPEVLANPPLRSIMIFTSYINCHTL